MKLENRKEIKMKYRVWYQSSTYCYVDIEAESEDEANEIANHMDGGDFISTDDGDWGYLNTEEL